MLSVGEPFGGDEHLYAPSGSTDVNAIFRDNFEGDPDGTYEKLAFKLNGTLGFDKLDRDFHLRTNSPQGFFEAVREQACEYYDLPPMCKGRCILAYKMFPDYICNDFEQVHSYLRDPRIGVVHMMRDEAAVSASNARRFNGYSDWKVDRDLRWKDFLTNISKRELTGHNVWMELNAEDIFPSADAYMKKVKQMLSMLDLDDQAMLAPVDHYIRRKFDEISANNHTAR